MLGTAMLRQSNATRRPSKAGCGNGRAMISAAKVMQAKPRIAMVWLGYATFHEGAVSPRNARDLHSQA